MKIVVALLLLAVGASLPAAATVIPKCAVQVPGKTASEITSAEVSLVEKHMNEPSSDVDCLLSEQMTGLLLSNPRVVSLYSEVIGKSTRAESIRSAVRGIEQATRGERIPAMRLRDIAAALQNAGMRDDIQTRLNAARALAGLGEKFWRKADQIVAGVLHDYEGGKRIGQEVMSYRLPFYSDSELNLSLAILAKDSDPNMVATAILNVDGYIDAYKVKLNGAERIPQIASELKKAANRQELGILARTNAANALAKLGDQYQEAGYAAKLAALADPGDLANDWARRRYEMTLLEILRANRASDWGAVQKTLMNNHAENFVYADALKNPGDKKLAELADRLRTFIANERR